ncbi:MAG: 5-methylcytosine-specific restriction system specificity protein McrC, partial [Clostridiales bacterium]|nr:5-methylcytosine-specific restriction system specificity protein McrC [Clostridiales bacterium]
MIPVRNIYYMLTYAWENTLKQDRESLLGAEAFDNIYNLLTSVLIQGVNNVIKRGFARGYIDITDEMSVVRGKINLNSTIKEQTLTRKQLVCEYDDFSKDILLNRIIKTTMAKLLS